MGFQAETKLLKCQNIINKLHIICQKQVNEASKGEQWLQTLTINSRENILVRRSPVKSCVQVAWLTKGKGPRHVVGNGLIALKESHTQLRMWLNTWAFIFRRTSLIVDSILDQTNWKASFLKQPSSDSFLPSGFVGDRSILLRAFPLEFNFSDALWRTKLCCLKINQRTTILLTRVTSRNHSITNWTRAATWRWFWVVSGVDESPQLADDDEGAIDVFFCSLFFTSTQI